MKYTFSTILSLLILCACHNSTQQHQPTAAAQKDSANAPTHTKDFLQLQFAAKIDLSCGMPLTAGIADTALYKEKIYGFCSAECKADFLQHADDYVKKAVQTKQ